jgi:pre-rRNA-processing protein TSR4
MFDVQMTGNAAANPFGGGLGSQLFGVTAPSNTTIPESIPNKPEQSKAEPTNDAEDTEAKAGVEAGDAAEDELVTAIAAATLEDSVWLNVPAYPALYLSTCSEYLPPAPKIKLPVGTTNPEDDLEGGQGAGGGGFAPEGYENSMDTDPVFDRFSARVAHEPEQCLR